MLTTQAIILQFHKLYKFNLLPDIYDGHLLLVRSMDSLKFSKLFPHLVENYCDNLGTYRAMYTDGKVDLLFKIHY